MHDSSLESSAKEVIALRLLELRRRLGFTQGVMAAKLGVSDRTYKYYEQGQRDAPLLVLIQAAALANADLHWLLTGESREIPDLDLYDRALVAVLDELPKRGLSASSGRAVTPCSMSRFSLGQYNPVHQGILEPHGVWPVKNRHCLSFHNP